MRRKSFTFQHNCTIIVNMSDTKTNLMQTVKHAVGDMIHFYRCGSFDHVYYRAGKITKITEKGQTSVTEDDGQVTRFDASGKEIGGEKRWRLDTITFEARKELMAQRKRAVAAADSINAVTAREHRALATWQKTGLMEEVERLQALLNAAKAAVEAI